MNEEALGKVVFSGFASPRLDGAASDLGFPIWANAHDRRGWC